MGIDTIQTSTENKMVSVLDDFGNELVFRLDKNLVEVYSVDMENIETEIVPVWTLNIWEFQEVFKKICSFAEEDV